MLYWSYCTLVCVIRIWIVVSQCRRIKLCTSMTGPWISGTLNFIDDELFTGRASSVNTSRFSGEFRQREHEDGTCI